MSRDPRAGERGLSLIEALVIVTVTALLALVLLPLSSGAAGRNFARADRALAQAEAAAAEREFRALLHGAVQDERAPLSGNAYTISFVAAPDSGVACVGVGAPTLVRLLILADGEKQMLACEAGGRRVPLLRWPAGQASFSYSADGAAWAGGWSDPVAEQRARGGAAPLTHSAPLVRFAIAGADVNWIEHAGWSEPVRVAAEAAP